MNDVEQELRLLPFMHLVRKPCLLIIANFFACFAHVLHKRVRLNSDITVIAKQKRQD